MTDARIVLVTHNDPAAARDLARKVVEAGLVGCVNVVGGVASVYRWKGEICESAECLMILKTRLGRISELEDFIRKNHTDENPEFLVLDVESGSRNYLVWLFEQTSGR